MSKSHRQKVADRRKKRQRRGRQKFPDIVLSEAQSAHLLDQARRMDEVIQSAMFGSQPDPPVCVTNPHWRNWTSIFPDNYKIDASLPSDKRPMTTAEMDSLMFFGFPEDTNPSAEPAEKGE